METKKKIDASEIKILICCHKKSELPQNIDDVFLPIQVGATISDTDLGLQRDDQVYGKTCDNISAKNKNYCELTALYWAWKNIKKVCPNIKYIGLNHYRRFFDFDKNSSYDLIEKSESEIHEYKLNIKKIVKGLNENKIIIGNKKVYPYPLYLHYCKCHFSDDFKLLQDKVSEVFPNYKRSFNYVFEINNKLSPFNMFIMKYEDFVKYCEWLFKILFEVENKKSLDGYSPTQARIYGYMAERLLNVYIFHNKIKTKNYPVACYVEKPQKKLNLLKYFFYRVKNNLANHLIA